MDEDLDLTAFHEAGHAFMTVFLGGHLRSVTIEPDRDDGPARFGDTQLGWDLEQFSPSEVCSRVVQVALAGPVAEMLQRGEALHPGFVGEWASDWRIAWDAAQTLIRDEKKRLRFIEQEAVRLYRFLNQEPYWSALAAIADNLLAHETLEGEQVLEIVQDWLE